MNPSQRTELEAEAFRRLIQHLQAHPEAQNIDLMLTADFCRNCLAKWLESAARERGLDFDRESALHYVYGMPYEDWKSRYQQEASPEKIEAYKKRQAQQSQQ